MSTGQHAGPLPHPGGGPARATPAPQAPDTQQHAQAAALAADLRAATASLSAWIEARAAELAAGEVARVEAIADARCEAYEQAFAVERRRNGDLVAELRRQVDHLDRWQQQHVRGRCVPVDPAAEYPGTEA